MYDHLKSQCDLSHYSIQISVKLADANIKKKIFWSSLLYQLFWNIFIKPLGKNKIFINETHFKNVVYVIKSFLILSKCFF